MNSNGEIYHSSDKSYPDCMYISDELFEYFTVEKKLAPQTKKEMLENIRNTIKEYDNETVVPHTIRIMGNNICLYNNQFIPTKFYTITSDGIFKEVEPRRRTKIYR